MVRVVFLRYFVSVGCVWFVWVKFLDDVLNLIVMVVLVIRLLVCGLIMCIFSR